MLSTRQAKQAEKILSNLGPPKKRKVGRPRTDELPNTLRDNLLEQLEPRIMRGVAKQLVNLALNGGETVSLKAIQEIFDRIEGKVRATEMDRSIEDNPLVRILENIIGTPKQLPSSEYREVVDAEYVTA